MPEKLDHKTPRLLVRDRRHGLAHWTEAHADAWIGLLETHKQLTRALDAELTAQHGLSLSGLELLARLAAADDRQMHLTALAGASGLSLSRVSRIIGVLEERKLVDRHAARATPAPSTRRSTTPGSRSCAPRRRRTSRRCRRRSSISSRRTRSRRSRTSSGASPRARRAPATPGCTDDARATPRSSRRAGAPGDARSRRWRRSARCT